MIRTLAWVTLVVSMSCQLMAWPEDVCTDAQLVARTELIVVGHIKQDSLKHQPRSDSRAVLVITRVVKGVIPAEEIPVSISLFPAPNTYKSANDFENSDVSPRTYDWSKPIVLFDNNPDGGSPAPLIDDIRKDQVWLIRKQKDVGFGMNKSDTLGIFEPQDIQPLAKEKQFRKYVK